MTANDWLLTLKEGLNASAKRVNEVRGDKQDFLVFGTGATTELHFPCFDVECIHPLAYVDNNESKYASGYHGVPVVPPRDIPRYPNATVLLCSYDRRTCRAIGAQLQSMEIPFLTVAEFVYARRAKEILANAAVLDQESLCVYADRILAQLENRPPQYFDRTPYFALQAFTGCAHKEVFVDIGAYVGDTIEQYLYDRQGAFTRIYGIEPNPLTFLALSTRVERLHQEWALTEDRIRLIRAGIGKISPHGVCRDGGGTNALLGARVLEIPCIDDETSITIYTLDELFKDERVGFIKADIEGYEMNMLQGGMHIIKRDRPKIAVCIYHNCSDMYRILTYLRQELTDYQFGVRHHSTSYCETVLYACPNEMAD